MITHDLTMFKYVIEILMIIYSSKMILNTNVILCQKHNQLKQQ